MISKKSFKGLKFNNLPILMGVLNLNSNSFSDGKIYKKKFGYTACKNCLMMGAVF